MAAKIITVAIEKGGTGKTVTTSNLAYLMGLDGKRVLCIDTDPQGNLTSALSDGRGEMPTEHMMAKLCTICLPVSGLPKRRTLLLLRNTEIM